MRMPAVLVFLLRRTCRFLPIEPAVVIAGVHYGYPRRDGQVEFTLVAALNTKTVYLRTVTHPSGNQPVLSNSTWPYSVQSQSATVFCHDESLSLKPLSI